MIMVCVRLLVLAGLVACGAADFEIETEQELWITVRSFLPRMCDTNNPNELRCPYYRDIKARRIMGHPDFEKSDASFGLKRGIVKDEAARAENGMFKPQYGDGGGKHTSGPQFFKSWYSDDPKYNKRIGTTLNLGLLGCDDSAMTCTYQYDSDNTTDIGEKFFGPIDFLIPQANYITGYPEDYEMAPIWPLMKWEEHSWHQVSGGLGQHKYSFSTEIHSFFKYRGEDDSEIFSFSGDDDVWLFIDGRLVLDLGGIHGRLERTVNLKDFESSLGLEKGKFYSFDLFHAERHTGASNAKITTTLSAGCTVRQSGTKSFDLNQVTSANKDELLIFKPNPNSAISSYIAKNRALLLQSMDSQRYVASYVFLREQQNAGTGFTVRFSFETTGSPDGFAFVLHRRPEGFRNFPESTAEGLGYRYLTHSVAVAFDFCGERANAAAPCKTEGVSLNFPDRPDGYNGPQAKKSWDGLRLFKGQKVHDVEIRYYGNDPNWIEVYIDKSLYLQRVDFNLEDIIGGRNAYFGFTTSTGGKKEEGEIKITNFAVETVSFVQEETVTVDKQYPNVAIADGETGAPALTIQTRDLCEHNIGFGGFGNLFKGVFVEKINPETGLYFNSSTVPAIIPGVVADNGDGTYAMTLATNISAEFELTSCFGSCWLSASLEEQEWAPQERRVRVLRGQGDETSEDEQIMITTATVALTSNSSSDSYFKHVPDALTMVPSTASPTAAPTEYVAPTNPPQDNSIKYAAVGGGVTCFALLALAGGLCIFRRRWKNDKTYIEKGREHRLGQQITSFQGEDDYNQVSRAVLETRTEILKERAATYTSAKQKEVSDLMEEKEQLQEQLRLEKRKAQLKQTDASFSEVTSKRNRFAKKKKEFQVATPQV